MMDNRTNKRKNYTEEDGFLVYILLLPSTVYKNETLKWLSSLPILMQESFWW